MAISDQNVGDQATAVFINSIVDKLNLLPDVLKHGGFTAVFTASAVATATVSFGYTFPAAPNVTLDIQPYTSNTPVTWGIIGITTTGFTYYARTTAGGTITANLTGNYTAAYN